MRSAEPRIEVREVDRRAIEEYGMSGLVLMENAGRGCVDTLCRLGCRGPVAVVCGKGNNAGDGFVIARHLDLRPVPVKIVLLGSPDDLRGDAAANYAHHRPLRGADCRFIRNSSMSRSSTSSWLAPSGSSMPCWAPVRPVRRGRRWMRRSGR